MPELLLGLDIGTSTLTACLFAPNGDLLARTSAPVRTTMPAPGHVEQDAARIWSGTRQVIKAALSAAGRQPSDLAAIGVTSQRTSAVLWDRRTGRPLTPLVNWSDLRGAARAGELMAQGHMVFPQQASAKLEAMRASVPAGADIAFGNIDSYIIFKLSGHAAHLTDASQGWPTGYLSLGAGWNTALIEHQGLSDVAFPHLTDTWGHLAVTHPSVFGCKIPICADMADQQAALVGQGAEAAGACKITFGTSAMVDVSTGDQFVYGGPTIPPFVLSSVAGQTRFCIEGMVYSAGSGLDWLRAAFRLGDAGRFDALAAGATDGGGVFVLPAFQGLGAPYGDLGKRAVIGGLSLATTPAQIARAGVEGLACRVREVVDHLYAQSSMARPEVLRADGGLTSSDVLMQASADVLGGPIARHAHREATACGAAICAGRGAGVLAPADEAGFVRYDRTFEPGVSADQSDARFEGWKRLAYT